ncbi:MAG: hypothetical protein JNK02_15115 [Planctomycetes bacterium]|nr:hypothetical protein [Planctomycetota bacterium]
MDPGAIPPDLVTIPPGYRVESDARGRLAVAAWAAPALAASGFTLHADGELVASDLAGRKALSATRDGSIVVRRFTHGGLLRVLTGARFADARRPFIELALSDWLTHQGVDTPPVAAARARRAPLWGHELLVATRRVAGARDLESLLVDVRAGRAGRARLRPALRALGRLVARLHALGFLHADLTPKNVLVEERAGAEPRLWLLDLDRSRVVRPLPARARHDNLRRLWRYVDRRERHEGQALTAADLQRFLAAYEPDRAARRALVRAIGAAHARRRVWHAAGWLLEAWSPRTRART